MKNKEHNNYLALIIVITINLLILLLLMQSYERSENKYDSFSKYLSGLIKNKEKKGK
jgi:hypothetical protein